MGGSRFFMGDNFYIITILTFGQIPFNHIQLATNDCVIS